MLLCSFTSASSWPMMLLAVDSLRGIDPDIYVPGLSEYPLWDSMVAGTVNMIFAGIWMYIFKKNPIDWQRYFYASITTSAILMYTVIKAGVRAFENDIEYGKYIVSTMIANLIMFIGVYYLEKWLCEYSNPYKKNFHKGMWTLPDWRYKKYQKYYKRIKI